MNGCLQSFLKLAQFCLVCFVSVQNLGLKGPIQNGRYYRILQNTGEYSVGLVFVGIREKQDPDKKPAEFT